MSYQYYAMDLGEIFWLLLVLSLWILSIVCCIKRYEKISTIERADMISRDKSKINSNEVSSTTSANLNATTNNLSIANSCTNLKVASNTNLTQNIVYFDPSSAIKNNGYIPNSNANNNNNKINFIEKPKLFSNFKNVIVIDETLNNNNMVNSSNLNNAIKNKFRYEIVSYTKYNQFQQSKNNRYNQNNYTPSRKFISNQNSIILDQIKRQQKQYFISNNLSIYKSNQSKSNDINLLFKRCETPLRSQIKSSSEPALHNLILSNNNSISESTNHNVNKVLRVRATSIDDNANKTRFIIKSTSSLSNLNEFDPDNKRVSIIRQDTNYLIDPKQIPKIIRKSLLELHKKSMLNVSQHNSGNNFDNNTSSVFTQQRHKNEIKIRVNKT